MGSLTFYAKCTVSGGAGAKTGVRGCAAAAHDPAACEQGLVGEAVARLCESYLKDETLTHVSMFTRGPHGLPHMLAAIVTTAARLVSRTLALHPILPLHQPLTPQRPAPLNCRPLPCQHRFSVLMQLYGIPSPVTCLLCLFQRSVMTPSRLPPQGSSERWDGLRLLPRPTLSELASHDPSLLSAMQQLNTVDALLYSAAVAAFIARCGTGGGDSLVVR